MPNRDVEVTRVERVNVIFSESCMIRIWSEYLPYEDAASQDVQRLLSEGPLHPIFAVHHDADLDALARLLEALGPLGLEIGVWPLLTDEQGYWPCEQNAPAYFARVSDILAHLDASSAPLPAWLAVDLEPPIHQIHALRHQSFLPHKLLRTLRSNLNADHFEDNTLRFQLHLDALRGRYPDLKMLAVTLPMAAHDLGDGVPLWQDAMEAPWSVVSWDRAGVMAYGSMVAGYSRGALSIEDARSVHVRLAEKLVAALDVRAHVSLGITGAGKLGDEPVYEDVEELVLDVGAMRALGIEDLGIFCLEGLVGREDAGQWVDAIVRASPHEVKMTPRARVVRAVAHTSRGVLRRLRRGGASGAPF